MKTELYRRLGVGEYWMFDPQGGLHEPRLQGNALCCGRYVLIKPAPRPGVPLAFYSPVLDLELHFDSDRLRFCEPEAAGYLRTAKEAYEQLRAEAAARRAAEARAQAVADALREAKRRIVALEAELGASTRQR